MDKSQLLIKKRRVAIVHDALCVPGGAERLTLWMSKVFPEAPIFTSVYLPEQTFPEYKSLDIRTLPFANFIKSERMFKLLFPLWLTELQRINFSEFDIVLTSSTYLAKFIHPAPSVEHKCYLHAPFRLLWKPESYSVDSLPTPKSFIKPLNGLLPLLREWDRRSTQIIASIATNSQNMAAEIISIYKKEPVVIYPPVSVNDFAISTKSGEYYLTVSRLISHKRVDLAIEACNQLKRELIVVGDGPERKKLEQISGDTIHFVGRIFDQELKSLYSNSKALIFPSQEDFGIVPVEAQACGKPVIAFGRGGALETIKEGETGVYFKEQTVESLINSLLVFENMDFNPNKIREWVMKFDVQNFNLKLRNFVGF